MCWQALQRTHRCDLDVSKQRRNTYGMIGAGLWWLGLAGNGKGVEYGLLDVGLLIEDVGFW